MRPDRSADLLRDILDFIDRIETWIPGDATSAAGLDEKTLYAVLHALQYIGEVVSRLPSATTDLAPQIPWAKIRSMRNLIAHDYAGIDTTRGDAAAPMTVARDGLPKLWCRCQIHPWEHAQT